MNCFLYGKGLRHERVKGFSFTALPNRTWTLKPMILKRHKPAVIFTLSLQLCFIVKSFLLVKAYFEKKKHCSEKNYLSKPRFFLNLLLFLKKILAPTFFIKVHFVKNILLTWTMKKQPVKVFYKKSYFEKLRSFHRKTPALKSLFIKLQTWEPATLLKRDTNKGVSCEICEIFNKTYFKEHQRLLLSMIRGVFGTLQSSMIELLAKTVNGLK